jgi:anti-anti-sigma factor
LITIRRYDREVPVAALRVPIEPQEPQLRILSGPKPSWLRISGEIDAWNVETVRDALREALPGVGDLHLDVSRLLFCDVTGIRAIVSAAANLSDGRRLVLHGLDPRLQRVFGVVGWGGIPGLVIDDNGLHQG